MDREKITNKKLGEILIELGVISHKQLEQGLALQQGKGGLIGEILADLKFITEEHITTVLAAQYGFAYLPLKNYEIDKSLIKLIPERIAREYCVIPVDKISNTLSVAMSNPLNQQAVDEVEAVTGCDVEIFVSTSSDVKQAIDKYYKSSQ